MIWGYSTIEVLLIMCLAVVSVMWFWSFLRRKRALDRLGGSDILGSIEGWDLRIGRDKRGRRVITIEILTRAASQDHSAAWMYAILKPAEARQLARWLRAAAGDDIKAVARPAMTRGALMSASSSDRLT